MSHDATTTRRPLAVSVCILCAGMAAVFAAHVYLPFYMISASRNPSVPRFAGLLLDLVDPALSIILLPYVLAVFGYSTVLRKSGIGGIDQHEMRVGRRIVAGLVGLVSGFVGLDLWINTFGS